MLKIDTLAQLEELLKVCHMQNVHAIKIDGIEIALSPVDPNSPKDKKPVNDDPLASMSEEDIMMWSAR